jgi:hypothetical protein
LNNQNVRKGRKWRETEKDNNKKRNKNSEERVIRQKNERDED